MLRIRRASLADLQRVHEFYRDNGERLGDNVPLRLIEFYEPLLSPTEDRNYIVPLVEDEKTGKIAATCIGRRKETSNEERLEEGLPDELISFTNVLKGDWVSQDLALRRCKFYPLVLAGFLGELVAHGDMRFEDFTLTPPMLPGVYNHEDKQKLHQTMQNMGFAFKRTEHHNDGQTATEYELTPEGGKAALGWLYNPLVTLDQSMLCNTPDGRRAVQNIMTAFNQAAVKPPDRFPKPFPS